MTVIQIIQAIGLIPYAAFTVWYVRKVIKQYRDYKALKERVKHDEQAS